MRQYLDLMEHILADGAEKRDRTGTGTLSVFGHQMRFDLADGFPLLTTKKLHLKSIVYELLWFLAGDTNIKYLTDHGVHIWDEWADERGELGPVYGQQWRSWPAQDGKTIDQISHVIDMIKRNPDSRRLIVTAWNPADVDKMALPPSLVGHERHCAPYTGPRSPLSSAHSSQMLTPLSLRYLMLVSPFRNHSNSCTIAFSGSRLVVSIGKPSPSAKRI